MAISRTVWVDDDGTGTAGTPINAAVMNAMEDRIDAALAASDAALATAPSATAVVAGAGLALMASPRRFSRRQLLRLGR